MFFTLAWFGYQVSQNLVSLKFHKKMEFAYTQTLVSKIGVSFKLYIVWYKISKWSFTHLRRPLQNLQKKSTMIVILNLEFWTVNLNPKKRVWQLHIRYPNGI